MRMRSAILAVVSLVLVAVPLGGCGTRHALAQSPSPGQTIPADADNVIRVRSNLILVPVSVTDVSGRPVLGLEVSDFRIEEDGVPQEVATLADGESTRLEIGLLLDVSGSLEARFDFEVRAATRFLDEILRPGDAVFVLSIGETPGLLVERTTEAPEAARRLRTLESTRSATAFFDSVGTAARRIRGGGALEARRVLIVLSDGEDNNSLQYQLARVHEELQHADCIFYSINPSKASIRLNELSRRGQEGLESLAAGTGGSAYVSETPEDLDDIFRRIQAELHAQYLLAYYAARPGDDGSFRRIAVSLPSHPELRVRSRRGYFAGSAPE